MLLSLFALGLAAVAYAAPAEELVQRGSPSSTSVYIKSLTWDGTGCPREQDTVGYYISDDRTIFTLEFDQFVASIGPGVAVSENRKNCQLILDLQYPQGWSYSILQTTFRGYVAIDAGVTATQEAVYYFSGEAGQATCSANFSGPDVEDYTKPGAVKLSSVVWSPCGASTALNIDSSVRLTATGSGTGQITDDSADGKIQFVVGIQWKTC